MPMLPKDLKSPEASRRYGAALSLGTNLAAGIVGCTLVGVWLDRRFDTGERYTLVGLFLGMVYGAYEVWRAVRALQAADEAAPAKGTDRKNE